MNKNLYLLSDELEGIKNEDFIEREQLIKKLSEEPEQFFSKLRHFQPQIGCLNMCKICSKHANSVTEYWNENRIRNVIAALKYFGKKFVNEKPYIVWDRAEHRVGVIFCYLDNDIGNYPYLDKFIKIAYEELGVQTRISTVGFSRHDETIVNMHKKINQKDFLKYLGGVRISFTPYAIGWCGDNKKFSKNDYIKDMSTMLSIYRPYYIEYGQGSRNMCVELRYKPLVEITDVFVTEVLEHMVICTNNYLYISKEVGVELVESFIEDPFDHSIKLSQDSEIFFEFDLYSRFDKIEDVMYYAHKFINNTIQNNEYFKQCELYLMKNEDGIYYSINPHMTNKGNYGINIYPKTSDRTNSGYIITERFFVNALIQYKANLGIGNLDGFQQAEWTDVYNVIDICNYYAKEYYNANKLEKSNYIKNEVLPIIEAYICVLQEANYSPSEFFNPNFTIDTGIICNMGRAIKEFKGITFRENEPLTPTHERNYGKHNSTMTKEGTAFRLSCDYDDNILIEKLDLSSTATENGQVVIRKKIQLNKKNEKMTYEDLNNRYLVPGQRRK